MKLFAATLLAASLMSSPTSVNGSFATFMPFCRYVENGNVVKASWYKHGKVTANGEHFDPNGLTAAHKKLPFGTILLLTYEGKSVTVRINDRGPYIKGREIDLSKGAAEALGCIEKGVCDIQMQIMYTPIT
jgi:rare lipoprotein A